jgi:hypothetical protein
MVLLKIFIHSLNFGYDVINVVFCRVFAPGVANWQSTVLLVRA